MQKNNVRGIARLKVPESLQEVIIWVVYDSVNTQNFLIEPKASILNKLEDRYIKLTDTTTGEEIILAPKKLPVNPENIFYMNKTEEVRYFKIESHIVVEGDTTTKQ